LNPAKSSSERFVVRGGFSLPARCALFEVLERYNGINDGMIGLGVRELAAALSCPRDTASRALHQLDDAGSARPTQVEVWRGRRAPEWRLMFYRCDKTVTLLVLNWPAQVASDHKDAKRLSVRPEGGKSRKPQ
jgi:hypothetical protein